MHQAPLPQAAVAKATVAAGQSPSLKMRRARSHSRSTILVVHSRLHAVRFRILSTHAPDKTDLSASRPTGHRMCRRRCIAMATKPLIGETPIPTGRVIRIASGGGSEGSGGGREAAGMAEGYRGRLPRVPPGVILLAIIRRPALCRNSIPRSTSTTESAKRNSCENSAS